MLDNLTCIRAAVMAVSANAEISVFILLSGLAIPLATSCMGLRKEAAKGEKEGKSSCSVLLDVLLSYYESEISIVQEDESPSLCEHLD